MSLIDGKELAQQETDPAYAGGYTDGYDAGRSDVLSKSRAIDLLERAIEDLEQRNQDLLVHNSELVARARKAENELNEAEINSLVLTDLCPAASDRFGSKEWGEFVRTVDLPLFNQYKAEIEKSKAAQ
jgi:hypothetical protein